MAGEPGSLRVTRGQGACDGGLQVRLRVERGGAVPSERRGADTHRRDPRRDVGSDRAHSGPWTHRGRRLWRLGEAANVPSLMACVFVTCAALSIVSTVRQTLSARQITLLNKTTYAKYAKLIEERAIQAPPQRCAAGTGAPRHAASAPPEPDAESDWRRAVGHGGDVTLIQIHVGRESCCRVQTRTLLVFVFCATRPLFDSCAIRPLFINKRLVPQVRCSRQDPSRWTSSTAGPRAASMTSRGWLLNRASPLGFGAGTI